MLRKPRTRRMAAAVAAISSLAAGAAVAAPAGTSRGPSTSTNPYVLPVANGVAIKSLLSVGDSGSASNGYEMVGIPDGLGAFGGAGGDRFTLFMNNELTTTAGRVRRHGQQGAFVERLRIDSESLEVEKGRDLINPGVRYWDYPSRTYGSTPSRGGANPREPMDTFVAQMAAFSRFCSGSLTPRGLLYDESTRRGYRKQIYFANEEAGAEGRVFGVTKNGKARQLPRLGLASWENTNVADTRNETTLTIGDEDGSEGQLWVHLGRKLRSGGAFDRAGLTNGGVYVVDLADEAVDSDAEFRAAFGKGKRARFTIGTDEEINWDRSGEHQNEEALARGLSLNRIEDGAFDPRNPDDYYFTTTEGAPGSVPGQPGVTRDGGGLWRLRFDNVRKPKRGGTLELLLDGTEAPALNKPDNMTIDGHGNLLIQEDPGNNAQLARIVAYDIETGRRGVLAEFDPSLFREGAPRFITQDEESSGIIDAGRMLGRGWFLFDAQIHEANPDPALVEYGQLLAMRVRNFRDVYDIAGSP